VAQMKLTSVVVMMMMMMMMMMMCQFWIVWMKIFQQYNLLTVIIENLIAKVVH
jgi:hypothetical protein